MVRQTSGIKSRRDKRVDDPSDTDESDSADEKIDLFVCDGPFDPEVLIHYMANFVDGGATIKPGHHPKNRTQTGFNIINAKRALNRFDFQDIVRDSQHWQKEKERHLKTQKGSVAYSDSDTAKRRMRVGPTRDATNKPRTSSMTTTEPPSNHSSPGSPSTDPVTELTSRYNNLGRTVSQGARVDSYYPLAVPTKPDRPPSSYTPPPSSYARPAPSSISYNPGAVPTEQRRIDPYSNSKPVPGPYPQPQPTRAIKSDLYSSRARSAPTLGTFQPFRVYRPRHAPDKAPQSVPCIAILDACAFGPENNSVSAYFLQEFGIKLEEESVIKLRIVATDDGPVQKDLEYHIKFTVKNRRNAPLLLGREWIEKCWEDCTFFTLKAGSKTKSVQSPEDLAELQRRETQRQQLASERNPTSNPTSSAGSAISSSNISNDPSHHQPRYDPVAPSAYQQISQYQPQNVQPGYQAPQQEAHSPNYQTHRSYDPSGPSAYQQISQYQPQNLQPGYQATQQEAYPPNSQTRRSSRS